MSESYYFDYNATTPVAPEVFAAMEPYLKDQFANPSSIHHLSRGPRRAVRDARKAVARLLNAPNDSQIIFTSGGTESNNAAIRAAIGQTGKKKVITSRVEHSSVLRVCQQLEVEGLEVVYLDVDSDGDLDFESLEKHLSDDVALVTLMLANNETGVIFDMARVAELVKRQGVLLHVDAVQAAGKHKLDVQALPVDFLSISAHKFYGPKGIGALYVRENSPYQSLILGGSQERGRRAGTENVPGIVGMGKACELAHEDLNHEIEKIAGLRDRFEKAISECGDHAQVLGVNAKRLPNTSSFIFSGFDTEVFLYQLDGKGVCASSGSACMSGSHEPSHVVQAMGLVEDDSAAILRFSFGRYTTEEAINAGIKVVKEIISNLKGVQQPSQVAETSKI